MSSTYDFPSDREIQPTTAAQTAGAPVAYRWRIKGDNRGTLLDHYPEGAMNDRSECEPLFASQPSPAATVETRTAPASCPNCFDESDCANVDICRAVEEVTSPHRSSAGNEVEEDDPDVLIAAHAIAVNGFGRPWDDFHVTNAFDTDQGDLLQYAQAAVSALRSRVLPQTAPLTEFRKLQDIIDSQADRILDLESMVNELHHALTSPMTRPHQP